MIVSEHVGCASMACSDTNRAGYTLPAVDCDPAAVSVVMIAEAPPPHRKDYFYSGPEALFAQTTVLAFNDAGLRVSSVDDILALGVYLTTAVKCAKSGYGIATSTVKACSLLLEQELALFPQVRAVMLMGDVAIKALNEIARRQGGPRVIPAGATYKLRGQPYFWGSRRAFPSYLQAGPSFFIEKSKRKMIAEDIAAALRV